MVVLWMFTLFCLASAIPPPKGKLLVDAADSSVDVYTTDKCMQSTGDTWDSEWCLECPEGELISFMNSAGSIDRINCSTVMTSSDYVRLNTSDRNIPVHQCEEGYVMSGIMADPGYGMATVIHVPYSIKCTKLDGLTYSYSDCYDANLLTLDNMGNQGYKCNDTSHYFTGYNATNNMGSIDNFICCPTVAAVEEPTDVVKIPMSTCLEVEPFYTDCGASCWSGQLSSNYVIRGIKVNGSIIDEVHCQPQENVTLSLIQVNKFVLQLYPFMVCPTNYLVTALWSQSQSDQALKTIKCNLLHPGQQMTHCELFDAEDDLAYCNTADGYYMGGVMLDKEKGITQVMCCHVIEFELFF